MDSARTRPGSKKQLRLGAREGMLQGEEQALSTHDEDHVDRQRLDGVQQQLIAQVLHPAHAIHDQP